MDFDLFELHITDKRGGAKIVTLNRSSLREQIRDTLLQRIGSGELAPGDRIVETRLAEEMEVSSIPVREAIRELVAIEVLESVPHKGARVREVSLSETIGALQVRSAIEPLALSLAASALRERCDELRREAEAITAAAGERDFIAYQKHNQNFHRTIVEASGNRVLLKVWDSLAFEVGARSILNTLESVDPVGVAQEHQLVVEALEKGDVETAASLLGNHAKDLVEHLQRSVTESQNQAQLQKA